MALDKDITSEDREDDMQQFYDEFGIPDVSKLLEFTQGQLQTNKTRFLVLEGQRYRSPKIIEFLLHIGRSDNYSDYVTFNQESGVIVIVDATAVVELWSQQRSRRDSTVLTYDNFARGLRYYYQSGIMIKTFHRYTFKFSQDTLRDTLKVIEVQLKQ